jgi:ATP-binding cassette subfamily C (CFTR/MRP) protein 1
MTVPTMLQLSLFNILRFPLVVLPKAVKAVNECVNAIGKIERFLSEAVAPKQDLQGRPEIHFNKVWKLSKHI